MLRFYMAQFFALLILAIFFLFQVKTEGEMHEKSYQALVVRFARMNNDLISAQRVYHELQQEYESYKVRAHNVLRTTEG